MHHDEHLLDEYALKRLPDPLAARLEEHLLVCDHCRAALQWVDVIREALLAEVEALPRGEMRALDERATL